MQPGLQFFAWIVIHYPPSYINKKIYRFLARDFKKLIQKCKYCMEVKREVHSWETRRVHGVEIFYIFPRYSSACMFVQTNREVNHPSFSFFLFISILNILYPILAAILCPYFFTLFDLFFHFFIIFSINYSSIQIFWYQNCLKIWVKCYRGPEFSFLVIFGGPF